MKGTVEICPGQEPVDMMDGSC